jgi:2-dehydro-3-deoxyphosphooctonate aldolase (KDO 8-P synthase)
MNLRRFNVGKERLGTDSLFLIAGPCVIESEELCLKVARTLKRITHDLAIPFIFKASYDKANRSSLASFRGPGLQKGLKILRRVKESLDIPVTSDVHSREEVDSAAEVLDIIQIPAFLCRQTDLLVAAAKTGKAVNVKKGQFVAPWDMKNVVEKLQKSGCKKILLTERGTTFGYNNLVADMRSISLMREFGYPVVFDATHSVQIPGGRGSCSGGEREFVPVLARAAVSAGADGIFLEVHPSPEHALCDSENTLPLKSVEKLLTTLKQIRKIIAVSRLTIL